MKKLLILSLFTLFLSCTKTEVKEIITINDNLPTTLIEKNLMLEKKYYSLLDNPIDEVERNKLENEYKDFIDNLKYIKNNNTFKNNNINIDDYIKIAKLKYNYLKDLK